MCLITSSSGCSLFGGGGDDPKSFFDAIQLANEINEAINKHDYAIKGEHTVTREILARVKKNIETIKSQWENDGTINLEALEALYDDSLSLAAFLATQLEVAQKSAENIKAALDKGELPELKDIIILAKVALRMIDAYDAIIKP